ncbi:MAG: ABC transporter substrate-binding protein [Haloechinothrix sp.]
MSTVSTSVAATSTDSGGESQPQRGGILEVATDADPGGLDPNTNAAFASWYVTELLYGSLLREDASGEVVPDVASSYEQVDDTTYEFTLREGIKFADGPPVTSADVKYSFERITDPETASPWASIFQVIEEIETPDDSTVVFHLKNTFAPFISYVAHAPYTPIIDRNTVEEFGDLNNHANGTGMFALESYEPGNEVVLTRNPNYYDVERPYLDGIRMRVMSDDSTRLAAVRSGQVQLAWFQDPRTSQLLEGAEGVSVLDPPSYRNEEGIAFNQTQPPFDDVRVRRAISVGIDREELIQLVLDGDGAIGSKIPPGAEPYGYSGDCEGLPYNCYDPDLARELLAQAGYSDGLETQLHVSPQYQRDVRTAEIIRDQLAEVGVDVEIVQADWTTTLSNYVQTTYDGMSMIGLVWQPDPDADVHDIWHSSSAINLGKFSDPEVDRLIDEGRSTTDIEERAEIYLELQRVVADNAYMVFPYTGRALRQVVGDRLNNFTPADSGLHAPGLRDGWLSDE